MKILQKIVIPALLMIIPMIAVGQADKTLSALSVTHELSLHQMNATWTNQNGEDHQLIDLKGQPIIVVMFYGKCTGSCPVLMQQTWKLYQEISPDVQKDVQVVAVSFDYKNDTPDALKMYAEYEQLDLPNWNFVTAPHSSIRELAMLLGVQYRERSDGHFEHTNLITILDSDGRISERIEGLNGDLKTSARTIEQLIIGSLQ